MTRPPGRLGRLGRAAAALAAMAFVLTGPPYLLARFTGWPLPRHLPTGTQLQAFLVSPLSDGAIIKGLACVVWLLWALTAAAVLIEAAATAAGHPAPRLPVIGPVQAVAATLISATVLTSLHVPQAARRSSPPLQTALTASTTAAGPLTPGRAAPAAAPVPAPTPPQAADSRDTPAARPRVYRVVPGDDLWAIAARFLGDGERWHELFGLNEGKPQPDGRALTKPGLIYPGWVLLLPPASGHHGPAAPPGHHGPRPPAPPRTPAPAPSGTRQGPGGVPSPAGTGAHPHSRPVAVHLPSGALIGISVAVMIAAALTLASIQRRRRYRPQGRLTGSLQPCQPPLPTVIAALRRAARPAPAGPPDQDPGPDPGTAPVTDPYLDPYDDDAGPGPGQHGGAVPGGRPAPGPEHTGQASPRAAAAGTDPPPAREPGTIPVGVRGTSEAALDVAALGGLGLTGPGAPAAARAILAALLARAQTAPAGMPPAIIIPAADAARLLPGQDTAPSPGRIGARLAGGGAR